jgi:hypothetical protein
MFGGLPRDEFKMSFSEFENEFYVAGVVGSFDRLYECPDLSGCFTTHLK